MKKGLGKGLDALFQSAEDDASIEEYIRHEVLKEIKISEIDPNVNQPRKTFDDGSLSELADSIKQHGVLQPIILKTNGKRYQIIAGERRWRAARMAGLKVIPAILKDYDTTQSMEIAMVENLQRENLNPIEEAEGIKLLLDMTESTQEEVAQRIGKSRSAVANSLRLLILDPVIQKMIADNSLSSGHARALLSVDGEKERLMLAAKTVKEGYNVRQLENLVKKLNEKRTAKRVRRIKHESLSVIEEALQEYLGTRVEIVHGKRKGMINIEYFDENDLARIVDLLIK